MSVENIVPRDSEYWQLRTALEGADATSDRWKGALSRAMEIASTPGVVGEAMRRAVETRTGFKITRVDDLPEAAPSLEQDNAPLIRSVRTRS